ncbi:MAG: S8 family serine peptidase [Bacteroidota bacterium]
MSKDKYILLLKKASPKNPTRIQNELNIRLTSSKELNSNVRAQDIFDSDSGILFKNLGIAVAENIEESKLERITSKSALVLHWEKERQFGISSELNYISKIKDLSLELHQNLVQLADFIEKKQNTVLHEATWGLKAVNLTSNQFTGKGVKIAILDTGFYIDHPDFSAREIFGTSFISGEQWKEDYNGHGSHCTGIALGNVSSDGKRYGVAKNGSILIGKVLDDLGNGNSSSIIDGIDWALEKGAKIISMSFGAPTAIGERPSVIFESIGKRALEQNCLLIAAAGNHSNRKQKMPRPVSCPANSSSIMAVSALDENLKVADFANAGLHPTEGGQVDLAAPGVQIFSSYSATASNNKLYKKMNGTSMATPFVSGLAALYWEAFPEASARKIWSMLVENAKKIDNQDFRDIGSGLVQAL